MQVRIVLVGVFGIVLGAAHAVAQVGVLHAPVVVLPPDSPPFQRLFDADGDGDLDAVGTRIGNWGNVEIRVWRNDTGTFVPAFTRTVQATLPGTIRTAYVGTGDLDGDGDQDIAVGAGQEVFALTNTGAFTFTTSTRTVVGDVRDLAVGDFDGNGRADVATLNLSSGSFVRVDTGSALLSAPVNALQPESRLVVLDTDGDAAQELLVTYRSFVLLCAVNQSTLVANTILQDPSLAASYAVNWAAGDIDNDGDTDLVAFAVAAVSTQSDAVHVFRRTGASTWSLEPAVVGGPATDLADVDGDGDLDGVNAGFGTANFPSGGNWPQLDFGSFFSIATNRGGGAFAPAFTFSWYGSLALAGVGDIDLDGNVDLVAGACVFRGRGPWDRNPLPTDGGFSFLGRYADYAVDRDRDGDPDVVVRDGIAVTNRGDGSFDLTQASLQQPAGTILGGCGFVGDFDGDGAPEEVWPLFASAPPNQFVEMGLWRNNGSGVMTYAGRPTAPGVRMTFGWAPEQSSVADLDGDGDVDAIGNSDPRFETRHSEVWWNDGTGFFTAGPTLQGERFEGAADFDTDGRIDLVTSTGAGGDLRLRLGSGNPLQPFGAPLAVFAGTATGTFSKSVTLADADADGRVDVLVVTGSGAMHLWQNVTAAPGAPAFVLGQGNFLPMEAMVSIEPSHIEALDVDGDERLDLVAGPLAAREQIAVYRRLPAAGPGRDAASYAPPLVQVASIGFARDVDGDGDLDLMGQHIVQNLVRHGPSAGSRRQYGTPTAGEAGVAPVLGATGPFVVGGVVNHLLRGVTGPTTVLMAISLQEANLPSFPLPGITCLIDPNPLIMGLLPVTTNGENRAAAEAEYPILLPPGIQGISFYDQILVVDPAGPFGAAATNGLHIRVGS